ncbi:ribosome maturation factor RimM [Alphaproteobacteria bacterium]|jgi:16S rRNA processing protein RimM|nr:ribosome maturation factor RimM [Alphaproteobacteria bacterium]MDC1115580.1 ribosome maturation factor RimM [Alphaproteobacteria bacterium]
MSKPGRDHNHEDTHDADTMSRRILLAVITGAHGIRGAVKIKPFTERPENISAYGALCDKTGKAYEIRIERQAKDLLICRIKGINDRNAAEAVAKTQLYIDRSRLPEQPDAMYQTDMIGADIKDADDNLIGTATGFFDFGAGEMIEAALSGGRRVMLPFAESHKIMLDTDNRFIQMHIDPVWLEQPKKSDPEKSDIQKSDIKTSDNDTSSGQD